MKNKKRHHPTLEEVLLLNGSHEWLNVILTGYSLGDFADSENSKGEISQPSFSLLSGKSESEYGSFSYEYAVVDLQVANEEDLQSLNGRRPLGLINFYNKEYTGITLNISKIIYSQLIGMLTNNLDNLNIRIAIPEWIDSDIKCLPLLKYQVIYKYEK